MHNTPRSYELHGVTYVLCFTAEISLCKHLLYEGMGAAAASEAFDAEKLDIDQFASLVPDVLKKDNLVVRIRGHYYPWEAAAPLVLGMLSFGKEQMHELKGMIAVDQVEKTLEGDPSKAVVASGGSWRLWPFPFRRSRAIPSVQPAIVNTRQSDSENTKETTAGMDGNSSVCKPKLTKKKVRVIAPTSEQLASLNLKEGRNTITFTFSTAMLGKQQVTCCCIFQLEFQFSSSLSLTSFPLCFSLLSCFIEIYL